MLTTIAIILLLVAWLLGFVVFDFGSLIHLLLIIALVLVIKRLLQERKARYETRSAKSHEQV